MLDRQRRKKIDKERVSAVVRSAAETLRAPAGEVVVLLTRDPAIRTLNRRYRGKDAATDVLAFPGAGGRGSLGDVVISVDMAGRNALRLKRGLQDEVAVLALHGYLHLLGHDHERDQGQMLRLERRLRARLLARRRRGLRPGARRP